MSQISMSDSLEFSDDFVDTRSFQFLTKALLKMQSSSSKSETDQESTSLPDSQSQSSFRVPQRGFKNKCWNQFEKYSQNHDKIGIHISNISEAVSHISRRITSKTANAHIAAQFYGPNKILLWPEFFELCLKLRYLSRERNEFHDDPYHQLMKIQISTTDSSYSDANNLNPKNTNDEVHNSIFQSGRLKDVICDATKTSNRKMRKLQKMSATPSLPHYYKPLEKQLITEVVRPSDTCMTRRKHVKETRKEAIATMRQLSHRKNNFAELNRTVIACDRAAVNRAVKEEEERVMRMKLTNWTECREKEQITADNINQWKQQDLHQKSMGASTMKFALSSSSSLSKSVLELEKLEKSALKASRITKLSDYTSYQVDIPDSIQNTLKNTHRLSEYKGAKKQAEDLVNSTLSRRIRQQAESRQTAKRMAESSGGPVSIAPLRGEDYFNDSDDEEDEEDEEGGLTASSSSWTGNMRIDTGTRSLTDGFAVWDGKSSLRLSR